LKHGLFSSCFFDGFDLLFRLFDRLTADGTLLVLKELKLSAAFALAPYQQRLTAGVAFFIYEGLTAAVGASRHKRSAAS
jgi:hypothetical protein